MLLLKLMSGPSSDDSSPTKNFTLIHVEDTDIVSFLSGASVPVARITAANGGFVEYPLTGNAYVLSMDGKTIASRASYD